MKRRHLLPMIAAAMAMSCAIINSTARAGESAPAIPSMGDFDRKATEGAMMNVVFFGGSLTWGANATDPQKTSYRALVGEALRQKYPKTSFRFIDAAIGGTGSRLGIYRLERDVLKYNPDLVFLDFTLNDDMFGKEDLAYSSFEGILRKTLAIAKCPVFIVFTADKANVKDGPSDKMFRRLNHFKLASYYQLPVADVVGGMHQRYQEGKFEIDQLWPPDLFDKCHPSDKGYAVYSEIIMDAFNKAVAANVSPVLPEKWVNKPEFEYICRAKISDLGELPEGWRITMAETRAGCFDFLSSRWVDNLAIAENGVRTAYAKTQYTGIVPKPLMVKFKGSSVHIFGESTDLGGLLRITVDGKTQGNDYDAARFGKMFTPSACINVSLAEGLDPQQEHTLILTPLLSDKVYQSVRLESICVAGPDGAYVKLLK